MLITLAFRHLAARKRRSAILLLGFVFGVAAMIVLLSVGRAMLEQSRDVSLVGGGDVTVLPQGIDLEALRTGAASAQFFGIDRARFLTRQVFGGPRYASEIAVVAPVLERKTLYLAHGERVRVVRAGGEIPSRSGRLGAGLDLLAGRWEDTPRDSMYATPSAQQLYDDLDRFHMPHPTDTTWAEWHYFNVVTGPGTWLYITFMVRGNVLAGKGGGVVLVTRRRADGRSERYTAEVPPHQVKFFTDRADLVLGDHEVRQRDGRYHLRASASGDAGVLQLDLALEPKPQRYFPPVEAGGGDGAFVSGYVVPALSGTVSGTVCVAARCTALSDAPAYHDHNWGTWGDASWEWGVARGQRFDLVYGGVYNDGLRASPFILAAVDSFGLREVYRFSSIAFADFRPVSGIEELWAPHAFMLLAHHGADTLRLDVTVEHRDLTRGGLGSTDRFFVQMEGPFRLTGRMTGLPVADSGRGFFETYLMPGRPPGLSR